MTFLDYVNIVLGEVNEVPLTAQQLATARGLHYNVKNSVNRAYLDIVNTPESTWPWLQSIDTSTPETTLSGEKTITTIIDTELYQLPLTDPYKDLVDWDTVYLKDSKGGRSDIPVLSWPEYQTYKTNLGLVEGGAPRVIYQSADGKSLGVYPKPDGLETYTVYYRAWERPMRYTNALDVIPLPDQFSNVLIDGASHYVWRFRENLDQASFSYQKFTAGVKQMKQVYGDQSRSRLKVR